MNHLPEPDLVSCDMVLVGNTTPGASIAKIYASRTLIAQKGIDKVLEDVREIYRRAYERID